MSDGAWLDAIPDTTDKWCVAGALAVRTMMHAKGDAVLAATHLRRRTAELQVEDPDWILAADMERAARLLDVCKADGSTAPAA